MVPALKKNHFNVNNYSDLEGVVKFIASHLGQRGVLFLSGEVGVGKTKTVEYLLKQVGITEVSSPTFALHQSYKGKNINVDHFDFYRLHSVGEIEATGFWDIFSRASGWVIVEWPNLMQKDDLPKNWSFVEVKITLDGVRRNYDIGYAA